MPMVLSYLAVCAAAIAFSAVRTDCSSLAAVLWPVRSFSMAAKSDCAAAKSQRSRCSRPLRQMHGHKASAEGLCRGQGHGQTRCC